MTGLYHDAHLEQWEGSTLAREVMNVFLHVVHQELQQQRRKGKVVNPQHWSKVLDVAYTEHLSISHRHLQDSCADTSHLDFSYQPHKGRYIFGRYHRSEKHLCSSCTSKEVNMIYSLGTPQHVE